MPLNKGLCFPHSESEFGGKINAYPDLKHCNQYGLEHTGNYPIKKILQDQNLFCYADKSIEQGQNSILLISLVDSHLYHFPGSGFVYLNFVGWIYTKNKPDTITSKLKLKGNPRKYFGTNQICIFTAMNLIMNYSLSTFHEI